MDVGLARSRQETWESTERSADALDCEKIYNVEDEEFDVAEMGSLGGASCMV